MKQFNDITIIGIDQGYGNMKTANTIFPTAITAYDTAPMFKGDVLGNTAADSTAWARVTKALWQISQRTVISTC